MEDNYPHGSEDIMGGVNENYMLGSLIFLLFLDSWLQKLPNPDINSTDDPQAADEDQSII